jgi:ApbE superfamily uncharacterized protein (UPF0280 family)
MGAGRRQGGMGEREYRHRVHARGLAAFRVVVQETDLLVMAERRLERETRDAVVRHRHAIEAYMENHPRFCESLIPLEDDPLAPEIVREMLLAGQKCGVGPMAGIAGAVAHFVGQDLLSFSKDVIVENGGDIFMKSSEKRRVAIYAGSSPLNLRIAVVIRPERTPLGICTSSGTVGHSRSFGSADAVCIISDNPTLADAAATAVGNRVKSRADIEKGLKLAQRIEGVRGVLAVVGDAMGAWGDVELLRIE